MSLQQISAPTDDQRGQPVEFPPLSVLYKHSPACSISAGAILEVEAFARDHPEVPVFVVDVLGQQSLSQRLERQLGVEHRSPQVIVLRDGKPTWHRAGSRVRLDALEYAVSAAAP